MQQTPSMPMQIINVFFCFSPDSPLASTSELTQHERTHMNKTECTLKRFLFLHWPNDSDIQKPLFPRPFERLAVPLLRSYHNEFFPDYWYLKTASISFIWRTSSKHGARQRLIDIRLIIQFSSPRGTHYVNVVH